MAVLLCRRRSAFGEELKRCTLLCGGGVGLGSIKAKDPMGVEERCTRHGEYSMRGLRFSAGEEMVMKGVGYRKMKSSMAEVMRNVG